MTSKQLAKLITNCESELRQFVRWRDERLTDAAELALDIEESKQRLAFLRERKALLTRRENRQRVG